jgi:endonuclease YncB( thermonuclease family)
VPAVLIALLWGLFFQTEPFDLDATVNRVIDGMTLDAQIDGTRTAVGYLGIETPAVNQRCGREAMDRNVQLAGAHVWLVSDPFYDLDQQHRRLFYAFTVDGVSIDEMLIAEGLAHAVRTDAARGPDLAAIEAAAQANAQGCLWSAM